MVDPLTRRLAGAAVPPPLGVAYNPSTALGPSGSRLPNVQPSPLVDIRGVVPGRADDVALPAADAGVGPGGLDLGARRRLLGEGFQDFPAAKPETAPSDRGDVSDAIGRALIGFGHGFEATPASAAYSPVGAGIAGGLSGIGRSYADALSRRLAASKPQQEAQTELLKESAKRQAADPFEATQQARILERELQVARERQRLNRELIGGATQGLKPSDALAMEKQAQQDVLLRGVDPSSDEFGTAVSARVADLAQQARSLGATKVTPPKTPAKPAGSARPSLSDIFK